MTVIGTVTVMRGVLLQLSDRAKWTINLSWVIRNDDGDDEYEMISKAGI